MTSEERSQGKWQGEIEATQKEQGRRIGRLESIVAFLATDVVAAALRSLELFQ